MDPVDFVGGVAALELFLCGDERAAQGEKPGAGVAAALPLAPDEERKRESEHAEDSEQ